MPATLERDGAPNYLAFCIKKALLTHLMYF